MIPSELQLKNQGDFRVYRARASIDAPYEQLGVFPEGRIKARQRIQWVEIDTSLGVVDAARIHFIDPERVWAGYVAEMYRDGGESQYDLWTVKIGYHFAPEDTWATFTGVPLIENATFPRNGPPEVTIRLLSAGVVLQRNNSSLEPGVMSRHWLFGPKEPPSFVKALQQMAQAYGLELYLGGTEPILVMLDEHQEQFTDLSTEYLYNYYTAGPQWEYRDMIMPSGVFFEQMKGTIRQINVRIASGGMPRDDITDWAYLNVIRGAIQPLVDQYYQEQTGGVSDALLTLPKNTGNQVVFGICGNKLYFCRLRELIDTLEGGAIDEIVIYSYQCGDCSLLEFSPLSFEPQTGTTIIGLISRIFGKRNTDQELAKSTELDTTVLKSVIDAEMRVDGSPSDPQGQAASGAIDGRQYYRLSAASHPTWMQNAAEETILGMLSTNLRAQAVVLGSPFLRAGKLIGTYGLGVGPESEPTPDRPQRLNSYDRIWLVAQCTHHVDQTGVFVTNLKLCGASTDDSKDKIAAAAAGMASAIKAALEPASKEAKSWLQKAGEFLGITGQTQAPWEGF